MFMPVSLGWAQDRSVLSGMFEAKKRALYGPEGYSQNGTPAALLASHACCYALLKVGDFADGR